MELLMPGNQKEECRYLPMKGPRSRSAIYLVMKIDKDDSPSPRSRGLDYPV